MRTRGRYRDGDREKERQIEIEREEAGTERKAHCVSGRRKRNKKGRDAGPQDTPWNVKGVPPPPPPPGLGIGVGWVRG